MSGDRFTENVQAALRVLDTADAGMQMTVDTIKANGNTVSDHLLDSMLASFESVTAMARGMLEAVAR